MGVDVQNRGVGKASASDRETDRVDAFISYSHLDRAWASGLRDALQRRGKRVWLDEQELRPATLWADELRRAITGADSFVFVMSPAAIASVECMRELEHAADLNKRILPVNLNVIADDDIPARLRSRQFIPARGRFDDDREASLAQLVEAIETDLAWVRGHTDWGEKATEWIDHDRDRSFLLGGSELTEAETWLAGQSGKRPEATDTQQRFVLESRRASTRRTRTVLGAVAAALVVAVVLFVFALIQRGDAIHQRNVALAQSVRASAQSVEPDRPTLAALLAAEADVREPTLASQEVLRTALAGLRQEGHLPGGYFGTVSSDGTRAIEWAADGRPGQLWSLPQRRVIATVSDATVGTLAGTSSGQQVAVFGTKNGTLQVFNVANGHAIGSIHTGLGSVLELAGAPDAPIAVASDGRSCVVASLASGAIAHRMRTCGGPVISPHGQLVAYYPNGNGTALSLLQTATGVTHPVMIPGLTSVAPSFPNDAELALSEPGSGGAGHLQVVNHDGRPVHTLPDILGPVFAPGGKTMVATLETSPTTAIVGTFAFPSGVLESSFETLTTEPTDLALSGDGTVAAVVDNLRGTVTLFDVADGQALATLRPPGGVTDALVDETGSRVLTLNTPPSAVSPTAPATAPAPGGGPDAEPDAWRGIALTARSATSVSNAISDASLAVSSDGDTGWLSGLGSACLIGLVTHAGGCVRGYVADGALAPDGDRAVGLYQASLPAFGESPADAAIFAGPSPRRLALIKPLAPGNQIGVIALNRAGTELATGDLRATSVGGVAGIAPVPNGPVRVWSTRDGQLQRTLRPHGVFASSLAWSPDGSELAVAGQGGIQIYSATGTRALRTIPTPFAAGDKLDTAGCAERVNDNCPAVEQLLVISPSRILAETNESTLLHTGGVRIALVDPRTGHHVTTIVLEGNDITAEAAAVGGSSFAISTAAGNIQTYSARTGAPIGAAIDVTPAIENQAIPIALTADGRVLLVDDNGELSVYQVSTGDLLAQQAATTFAVANDGATLATTAEPSVAATAGPTVATFSCPVCGNASQLLPEARRVLTAPLSAAQRKTYLAGQVARFKP